MPEITTEDILKVMESATSYHKFRQELMHQLGKITETDEAQHQRNLYRAEQMRPDNQGASKMKYRPNTFKASRIEDEFAEFRQKDETVVVK